MSRNYFLEMIKRLREQEEVMLYEKVLKISDEERSLVTDFLASNYTEEKKGYPYIPPGFDERAAIWAAEVVYISAQLILYRDHKTEDTSRLIPTFAGEVNASSILSADICLRFLPDLIHQLKAIDSDDPLIAILDELALKWHYSAVRYDQAIDELDFSQIIANQTVLQLYADRVTEHKKLKLSTHPAIYDLVKSNLGMYKDELWKAFDLQTTHE